MKAFFIDNPGVTGIREIEEPQPGAGDLLLRVHLIGLCGSDLNSFRGKNPMVSFPRIPGHEIAATVEAAGSDVPAPLQRGTPVTVVPYTACGECPACRRGRSNACRSNQTLGVQRDGAAREWIAIPWEKVVPAKGLSLRQLVLVEPLSVGFHAAHRARITSDDKVAILGCGGVGLGAVAASAFRGADTIAVDMDDAKLDLAKKAGACHTINVAREDLHKSLGDLTGGDGPDVIIEAIGLPATFRSAVEEVAFTGRVVYIGYAKEAVAYETRLFVQKELDIMGSRNATPADFEAVIQMMQAGRFPVDDAISLVAPLESAGETLAAWDRNPASLSKVLLQITVP